MWEQLLVKRGFMAIRVKAGFLSDAMMYTIKKERSRYSARKACCSLQAEADTI